MSGRLIGTGPHQRDRAREVGEQHADERDHEPPHVVIGEGVPELAGVADLAEQRDQADEGADRHQEIGRLHPVHVLERWWRRPGICGHYLAQVRELIREIPSQLTSWSSASA
jgi:hypothetical protein